MEEDGTKRPDDEEELTPDEDADQPSEEKDSAPSEEEEFSLEGEMISQDAGESQLEDEGDESLSAETESDDEAEVEEQEPDEEAKPEEESPSESTSDEKVTDTKAKEVPEEETEDISAEEEKDLAEAAAEDSSESESTDSDAEEKSDASVAARDESEDPYHEEDGYEHWHDDHHDDYHGDGYHDDDYHEETTVTSHVEKSVTELERHEDEDIAALDDAIEEGHMTFLEHLEELRGTLFRCAGTFLVAFILVAVFFVKINEFLQVPLEKAMANHGIEKVVVTTTPFGIFSYLLQMAFLGALAISSPFLLYFITTFVAPGLTPKEKRALLPASLMALSSSVPRLYLQLLRPHPLCAECVDLLK